MRNRRENCLITIDTIQSIADATRANGGAAYDLRTGQFLPPRDIWSFPKYPGRTRILAPGTDLSLALADYLADNEQYLQEADCWLGTWIHPETHEFYLDITTGRIDLKDALNAALRLSLRDGRKIVAMYNAERQETVYL